MNVKNLVLGIGIIVVYALVLWQAAVAFYPQPEYDDYCDIRAKGFPIERGVPFAGCETVEDLDFKQQSCYDIGGAFVFEYDGNGCPISGTCDDCKIEYDDERDIHSRNIFIVSLIIGIITVIGGFSILKIEPVGSALVGSGIWAIFFGTVSNWRNFGASIRFVLLFIVLVVLIWIAIKVNTERKRGGLFGWRKKVR